MAVWRTIRDAWRWMRGVEPDCIPDRPEPVRLWLAEQERESRRAVRDWREAALVYRREPDR